MPTVTTEVLAGFAHCENPVCAGNKQERVDVVRTNTAWTYADSGGDLPGIEKTFEMFACADEQNIACGVCGRPRAATLQERPVYQSFHDPNFLTKLQAGLVEMVDGVAKMKEQDGAVAAMQAQIAQLQAMLLAQGGEPPPQPESAQIAEDEPQPPRRGPGRPRKDADA